MTGTQSIDRAAQLLVLVVEGDGAASVGELAERSGLPKSTVSRAISALERRGLRPARRCPPRRPARSGAARARPSRSPRRRPRRLRRAGARRPRRGERRDDQPRRADAARRRAPRPGRLPPLHRQHELARPPGRLSTTADRQGLPLGVVGAAPRDARLRPRTELRSSTRSARAAMPSPSTSSSRASPPWPPPSATRVATYRRRALDLRPELPPDASTHRGARTGCSSREADGLSARLGYRTTTQGAA